MSAMPDDEFAYTLSPAQVAKELHLSIETVRAYADKGHLPCWKSPYGYRRFKPADVEAFKLMGRS